MDNEKQLLISRILAGKIPAYDYEAELIYNTTLKDAIYGGCLTNQELLTKLGVPIDFVSEIEKNNTTLSNKKQKLYEWRDTPSVEKYREEIEGLRKATRFLTEQQYKFFAHSAEFVASEAKTALLCSKYGVDSIPDRLDETEIRGVARSYQWYSLYKAGFKFDIFTNDAIELINWTKRYENIHQHPDCPEDIVIEDDDLLDGWSLYISKKKEDNEPADGKDVFIPVVDEHGRPTFNPQKIKDIQDKNSPEAKFILKMREKKMMEGGEVEDKDLPDKKGIITF